jgi:ASC-1-like (ASCH) protein
VLVTDLKYYKDLLLMYTATFNKDFKNKYATPQDVVNATPYYTDEEVKKYGCVAINFKKINM